MNGHLSRDEGHLAHSREQSRASTGNIPWNTGASHTKDSSRAMNRVNWIYFLLGAAILLPWNAVITATPFFLDRLQGSPLIQLFSSYFSAIYQLTSFACLIHASYIAAQASKHRQIVLSHIVLTLTLLMLIVSTLTPTSPTPFFIFALSLGALQSSAGTYLLTAVVAYAAYFGPLAMQSVMSGQAAVAVVVSTVQLITTLFSIRGKAPESPPTTPGVPPTGNISTGASYFFAIATLGLSVSYIGYRRLTRMRLFKRTVAKFEDRTLSVDHITVEYVPVPADEEIAPVIPDDSVQEEDEGDLLAMSTSLNSLQERERELGMTRESSISIESIGIGDRSIPQDVDPLIQPRGSDFWHVWKLNAMYNVAVALIYVETLSVFPPITSAVRPVSPTENPEIFIAVHFLIYNVSDWFGRYVCSYPWAQIWSRKKLMALCVARMAFIVLFLLCNVNLGPSAPVPNPPSHAVPRSFAQTPPEALSLPTSYHGRQWPPRSPGDTPFFNSDIIFFMILWCFGFSNGWLTSLIMMAAPSLEHNKRMKREWIDLAAVGATFSLAAGLVIGSVMNFAIRGVMCGCNPFIE